MENSICPKCGKELKRVSRDLYGVINVWRCQDEKCKYTEITQFDIMPQRI